MKSIITLYRDSLSGLSRDVWMFAGLMFINRLGTLILPFLTLYTTQELGWTKVDAGAATMCFGIGSLSGALLGGYLTDKIGYYKTMMISLFSASVFFFILQYFSEFYVVCGLLFMSSLLADLVRPALMTGITFFTDKKTQTRAVSLMRIAFNIGFTVGPAIAGFVIAAKGYSIIFVMDSLTCFFAGVFLILFVKDKSKLKENISVKVKSKGHSPYTDVVYLLFLFFSFCMLVSFFQILFTLPLYMKEVLNYTEKHVGYFYAANGLLAILFEMPIIHYLDQQYDHFKVMKAGALLIGLSYVVFILPLPSAILVAVSVIFVSFGEIINFPFIASSSIDRANKVNVGQYMSANTVLFSSALVVAPIFGTSIIEAYGYNVLFVILFLLCIVSIVGLSLIKKEFYNNKFRTIEKTI